MPTLTSIWCRKNRSVNTNVTEIPIFPLFVVQVFYFKLDLIYFGQDIDSLIQTALPCIHLKLLKKISHWISYLCDLLGFWLDLVPPKQITLFNFFQKDTVFRAPEVFCQPNHWSVSGDNSVKSFAMALLLRTNTVMYRHSRSVSKGSRREMVSWKQCTSPSIWRRSWFLIPFWHWGVCNLSKDTGQ